MNFAAYKDSSKSCLVLCASLVVLSACASSKPLDEDFELELAELYTCARYYHLVGKPDEGDVVIERAGSRGKSERADPVDMMVVYLRSKDLQDEQIRDHVQVMPDAIGSKQTLRGLLDQAEGGEEEVNQLDQIKAADALYAETCQGIG